MRTEYQSSRSGARKLAIGCWLVACCAAGCAANDPAFTPTPAMGTFSMLVGTTLWQAQTTHASITESATSITFSRGNGASRLFIGLNARAQAGQTYSFPADSGLVVQCLFAGKTYHNTFNGTASLAIQSLEGNELSGTLSGTLVADSVNGPQLVLTDGQFAGIPLR